MANLALAPFVALWRAARRARATRRWRRLRSLGMHIGGDVDLPDSTTIDDSHCFLISIGDRCSFGAECHILAHDAQMNEYLDASRVGRVVIHESCHLGPRTVVLSGVEIGPRTIVEANSVVSRSLPPDTFCAGAPARVVCSLEDYLAGHRAALKAGPVFDAATHDIAVISDASKAALRRALAASDGYLVGGRRTT